jgi:hypothetical protein
MPMLPLEILKDSFMRQCCYPECGKLPQWHHVFDFAYKQIQDPWNIVPACKFHHEQATRHNVNYKRDVEDYFKWVALSRATEEELKKYSKVENYANQLVRLNERFSIFSEKLK